MIPRLKSMFLDFFGYPPGPIKKIWGNQWWYTSKFFTIFKFLEVLCIVHTLFRNKRFRLDEMAQQNASKFAIFYIHENLKLPFPFFILYYFIFKSPMTNVWRLLNPTIFLSSSFFFLSAVWPKTDTNITKGCWQTFYDVWK